MKKYLLSLIEADIYMLQRAYEQNKYKDIKKRLDNAKAMLTQLQNSRICPKKKSLPPKLKEEKIELIKYHLRNGEKYDWIRAVCNTSAGTITKIKRSMSPVLKVTQVEKVEGSENKASGRHQG